MDAFELVAKLKLDISEYESGLGQAGSDAKSFGSKLSSTLGTAAKAGAAAITAVTGASVALGKKLVGEASEIAAYGDSIDKMSQKVGLSAEAYQQWDYVLKISGTEMSSMTTGLKTLTNKLDDAKNGSKDSIAMFQKLGLSMDDIASMSREDVFSAVITGFQQMEESTERAALANDLFGRSGQELAPLFNTSAEETQKLKNEVYELGGVMSDDAVKASANFQDKLTAMQTALGGMKREILGNSVPAISDLVDGFTKLISGGEGAEEVFASGVEKLGKVIEEMGPKIGKLLETLLPSVIEIGGKLVTAIASQLPKVITAVAKQLPSLFKELLKTIKTVVPQLIQEGANLIKSLAEGMGKGDDSLIDAVMDALMAIWDAISSNYDKLIDAGMKILEKLIDGIINNLPKIAEATFMMIERLGTTIIEKLPEILERGKDILMKIVQGITENLPKIVQAAVDVIKKLAQTLIDNLPQILQAGIDLVIELATGIFKELPNLIAQIPQIIIDLVGALLSPENIEKLLGAGFDMIGKIFEGLFSGDFLGAAWDAIEALLGAFLAIPGMIMEIGSKIVGFILDGIKSAWNGVVDWVESGIEALLGDVNAARDQALAAQAEINESYRAQIEANSRKYHPEWYADENKSSGFSKVSGSSDASNFAGSSTQVTIYAGSNYVGRDAQTAANKKKLQEALGN